MLESFKDLLFLILKSILNFLLRDFNLLSWIFLLVLWVGMETNKHEIIKLKNKSILWLIYILIFIASAVGIGHYIFKTTFFWLFLSSIFPLFMLIEKWDLKKRIFYNIIFSAIIINSVIMLLQYENFKREIFEYISLDYKYESITSVDSEGDKTSRDYFYAQSQNKKLNLFFNKYFVVFYSLSILFISFFTLIIDKTIRKMISEIDIIENQQQENKELNF